MSAEELLPCPFCGGTELDAYFHRLHGYIECKVCGCTVPLPEKSPEIQALRWNRRTPPARSADHIGEVTNMGAPVEAVAWRWRWPETNKWHYASYNLHPEAEEVQPLYTHPPQPDALQSPAPIELSKNLGELRERVAQIIEAAIERHNPQNSLRHTLDDADEILALIQTERAG